MLRFSEKGRGHRIIRAAALRLLPVVGTVSLLLASCATIPPSPPAPGWLAILPPLTPDSVYASVDAASSRSLLSILGEATGNERQDLERITGNLDRIYVRLSPGRSPQSGPRLALIALGKFSTGPVARRLDGDPSWQRVMLEPPPGADERPSSSHWPYRTFWRRADVEIAVPQRGILFVTAGEPAAGEPAAGLPAAGEPGAAAPGVAELLDRFQRPEAQPLPAAARRESESADIFLYFPDPVALAALGTVPTAAVGPPTAAGKAQDPGALLQNLPIRQGWISARRKECGNGVQSGDRQGYELEAVFLLDQVEKPRSVELLLRLMLTLWLRKVQADDPVERLKEAAISVDVESARIDSFFLTDGEIASFLGSLLPESFGSSGLQLQ
jgi:hypothetical protein